MKRFACVVLLAVCVLLLAREASAIEPAYSGSLGNPEEPALRPYKWMWHGVKSFMYQPIAALEQGNRKIPGIGSVQLIRGARRGSIELGEGVFRGLAGERPPACNQYKSLGQVNATIDTEPFLRSVADLVAPEIVDAHPVTTPEERAAMDAKVKVDKAARASALAAQKCESVRCKESAVKRARRNYVGERADINTRPPMTGNLLRLAR